jgi:hypothetical protein
MAVRVCPERLNAVPMLDGLLTICCSMDHISAADGTMPLAPFSALGVVSEVFFIWNGVGWDGAYSPISTRIIRRQASEESASGTPHGIWK